MATHLREEVDVEDRQVVVREVEGHHMGKVVGLEVGKAREASVFEQPLQRTHRVERAPTHVEHGAGWRIGRRHRLGGCAAKWVAPPPGFEIESRA